MRTRIRLPSGPDSLRVRLCVTAAVSLVAALGAAWLAPRLMATPISPDFLGVYLPGALALRSGAGYLGADGAPISHYPPGFSLLIAPWADADPQRALASLRWLAGAEAGLWVVLLAWLATRVVPRVSLLMALPVIALWPSLLAIGNPTNSELPFTVLLTLAMCLLGGFAPAARRSGWRGVARCTLGAVALAAAIYVRPQGFVVAGAIALALATGFASVAPTTRLAATASFLATIAVLTLPWMIVQQRHTGQLRFASSPLVAVKDGVRELDRSPFTVELAGRSEAWQSLGDAWADFEDAARTDPSGAVRFALHKLLAPWYRTWSRRLDVILAVLQIPVCLLFVLSSLRVLCRWRDTPGEVILLHAAVVSQWGLALLVLPLFRYLAPSFPFVLLALLWQLGDLASGDGRVAVRTPSPEVRVS